jgi:hypothetical protein
MRASGHSDLHRDGAWFEVEVDGPMIFSEHRMTVDAAVKGIGIAFWVEHELRPLIGASFFRPDQVIDVSAKACFCLLIL